MLQNCGVVRIRPPAQLLFGCETRTMKWCCEAFRFAFDERHDRGIFVFCELPTAVESGPTYWIAMRSVRLVDRDRFAQQVQQTVPITIATWRRIKYCPWCGRNTHRFYRKTYQHLLDSVLTEEHGRSAEQAAAADAENGAAERPR